VPQRVLPIEQLADQGGREHNPPMTPNEMLKHMKEQEQRENELIAEANEICGAVKWDYKPFIHFPSGMWKVGAIWDQAYYEAAEYIVDGVCNRKLNPYVHGAAGVFLFRHYVELALKYILFHSRWLKDHENNAAEIVLFKNTHNLDWLWRQIKAEVPAKLKEQTWNGFDIEFIEKLVQELHKADPGSYGFRYNGETFGVEPSGIVDEVNRRPPGPE
jgi:hypothetical protein